MTEGTDAGARPQRRSRRRTLLLLAYGVVAAAAGLLFVSHSIPAEESWPLYRSADPLNSSIAAMDQGAPPLIERNLALDGNGPYDGVPSERDLDLLTRAVSTETVSAATVERLRERSARGDGADEGAGSGRQKEETDSSDEPAWQTINFGGESGIFVLVPSTAHLFDLTTTGALRLLFLVFFLVVIASYPLVFERITGSILAALVAPVALIVALCHTGLAVDIYWAQAWAALALLPLVWLLATRSRFGRAAVAAIVLIGVGASLASSLRGLAGLPIVLSAAIVIALRHEIARLRRVGLVALLIAGYLSVIPFATGLVRSHAESWAADNGGLADLPDTPQNFVWHNAYIGLGWLPNDDGITYSDSVAYVKARQRDPGVYPYTPEYADVTRDLYWDAVSADVGGFIELEAKKTVAVLHDHSHQVLLLLLLLPAALLYRPVRRRTWTCVWIVLPTLLVGLSQGLIAIPYTHYVAGFNGGLVVLAIMLIALFAAEVERLARARREGEELQLRPLIASPVLPAIAAVAIAFAWYSGHARGATYEDESTVWNVSSPTTAAIQRAHALRSPTLQEDQDLAYELGEPGPTADLKSSLTFNGGLGEVRSDYEPFANGSDRTFEGWAKLADNGANGTLLSSDSLLRPPILRVVAGTGDVQWFTANGSYATWAAAWPQGEKWVHWALVFSQDDGQAELFIDGKSVGRQSQPQPYDPAAGSFQLGAWGLYRNEPLTGSLAGVAVYEHALDADQVEAHYEAGTEKGGDYSERVLGDDPSLYWKLDERRGINVRDWSGNGNRGEIAWYG